MESKYDVLLVDAKEEGRLLMKEIIEHSDEFRLVADTDSGAKALELACWLRPDVVVAEAALPELDGFALMDALEGLVPGRVMVSEHCKPEILAAASERKIRFLPKPYQSDALLIVLRYVCGLMEEKRPVRWEVQVSRALHLVGVPAHIKGYDYLRRAILMVAEEPRLAHALTKELYPTLARQFGTTAACVERDIRTAVEAAWMRGNPEIQRAYFTMDKPSNGAFISAMAEKLRSGWENVVA